jgi:hypothetical protein
MLLTLRYKQPTSDVAAKNGTGESSGAILRCAASPRVPRLRSCQDRIQCQMHAPWNSYWVSSLRIFRRYRENYCRVIQGSAYDLELLRLFTLARLVASSDTCVAQQRLHNHQLERSPTNRLYRNCICSVIVAQTAPVPDFETWSTFVAAVNNSPPPLSPAITGYLGPA